MPDLKALKTMYDSIGTIGESRHIISRSVISQCADSSNPLDILATAIAYSREGANFRKQAIIYYEKFLRLSNNTPNTENRNINVPLFGRWSIYSDLGKLYEREYEFQKAIECYKKLIIESKGTNPADYTRIGDVYAKIDISMCIEYYRKLQSQESYLLHKHAFDMKLSEALERQRMGYVYRPRKRKDK